MSRNGKVSKEDIECLNFRRDKEKKMVVNKDSMNDMDCWYIINSEWLSDWKMFVNNKRSKAAAGARVSKNV